MLRRLFVSALPFGAAGLAQTGADRDLGTVVPGDSIRLAAFGDFGYQGSGTGQVNVAKAIAVAHQSTPYQIGLTMGDNFYPRGVKSTDDPKWDTIWEKNYGQLGFPFFATLGNHDYDGNEQAQIDYSKRSKSWRMPEKYFTFQAGPARFFALDTAVGASGLVFQFVKRPWPEEQVNWLDKSLSRFRDAPWKVVYGHHPIYSDGYHGDDSRLERRLLPLLKKHKVDFYIAGHEHELQYHHVDGIQHIIAGGGGKDLRDVSAKRAKFAAARHGYLDLSLSQTEAVAKFIGTDNRTLYEVKSLRGGSEALTARGEQTRTAP